MCPLGGQAAGSGLRHNSVGSTVSTVPGSSSASWVTRVVNVESLAQESIGRLAAAERAEGTFWGRSFDVQGDAQQRSRSV